MPVIVARCHRGTALNEVLRLIGGENGRPPAFPQMKSTDLAPRLARLPLATVLGHEVPVARGFAARLCGLAGLDEAEAGAGLLIPRCSRVHTFGMRFALDLVFLDREGLPLLVNRAVGARRLVAFPGAWSVLELARGESSRVPGL